MLEYKIMKEKITQNAFTLSEVLITLGIIGVVAAITLPILITNIQDRVKSARIQNIKQKFSKATDKMLSVSGLNGYASTEAFVTELQHHLKLAKICDNSHLQECWPTEKVIIDDDGKEWEISKTKTGKQLKMKNDDSHDWDNTMGIITADGTAMILSYNKKCDIDTNNPVAWSADSSSSSGCVAAVFDWNGAKKPNQLSKDVIAFNAGGLGSGCAFELGGKCFGAPFIPTPVTKAECNKMVASNKYGITSCYYNNDYWAGAVKQCGHVNNLPTLSELGQVASAIYEGNPSISAKQYVDNLTYKSGTASSLGFPEPHFVIWAGDDVNDGGAYYRQFSLVSTGVTLTSRNAIIDAMCLND